MKNSYSVIKQSIVLRNDKITVAKVLIQSKLTNELFEGVGRAKRFEDSNFSEEHNKKFADSLAIARARLAAVKQLKRSAREYNEHVERIYREANESFMHALRDVEVAEAEIDNLLELDANGKKDLVHGAKEFE